MNRFTCRIQLAHGHWERSPTPSRVREAVVACASSDNVLRHLTFLEPDNEETRLECRVCFEARWSHSEVIRDTLIETLSSRFRPEYDSMVEVEVLDD